MYGGRKSEEVLTAIAVCSVRKFEALQIVKGSMNAKDFCWFMEQFVEGLSGDRKVMILLETASWHDAALVKASESFKYLLFHEPRQYCLSLIEIFLGSRDGGFWRTF